MTVMQRTPIVVSLALLLATSAGLVSAQQAQKRFDFEGPQALSLWAVSGKADLLCRKTPADPPPSDDPQADLPGGQILEVQAAAKTFVRTGAMPRDLSRDEELVFWVHRTADEARVHPVSTLEAWLLDRDGRRGFWSKVELAHEGWKEIRVPLAWCRWKDNAATPQWDDIGHVGFYFRDPATITLDNIALVDRDPQRGAALRMAELMPVAFPDAKPADVRVRESPRWSIATDAPELDLAQLDAHFARIEELVAADVPLDPRAAQPILFVIHRKVEDYRRFPPRFGAKMNSTVAAPTSNGLTFGVISCSSWDERQGTIRSVYTHEFVHGLLTSRGGLGNHGEWLQEGLASWVQLRVHPQVNLGEIVTKGLANPAWHLPLPELTSGKKIPTDRYWQAATLVECLMKHELFAPRFPELLKAIRASGSSNLEPHLAGILKTDWDRLTGDWRKFCAEKYGRQ